MLKVNLDDVDSADEIFSILMGDEVESRSKFMEEDANYFLAFRCLKSILGSKLL